MVETRAETNDWLVYVCSICRTGFLLEKRFENNLSECPVCNQPPTSRLKRLLRFLKKPSEVKPHYTIQTEKEED